jgi:hypothetical protein
MYHFQQLIFFRKMRKQLSLAEAGVAVLSPFQLSTSVGNLEMGVWYEVGVPPFKKGQPLTVCRMQCVAVPDNTYLARMRNGRAEEVLVRRSAIVRTAPEILVEPSINRFPSSPSTSETTDLEPEAAAF